MAKQPGLQPSIDEAFIIYGQQREAAGAPSDHREQQQRPVALHTAALLFCEQKSLASAAMTDQGNLSKTPAEYLYGIQDKGVGGL